jgi:transcriptional regulator with GAF, ATPase, and Fis domain
MKQYNPETDLDSRTEEKQYDRFYHQQTQMHSLFEQVLERRLQTPIHEIPQDMASRLEQYLSSEAQERPLTLKDANAQFDRWYFPQLLKQSYGNLSKAGDIAGFDRRTLYRKLEEHKGEDLFDPDIYRPTKEKRQQQEEVFKAANQKKEYFKAEAVESVLNDSLSSFKQVLHPELYSTLETKIDLNAESIAAELNSNVYGVGRAQGVKEILSGINTMKYEDAHSAFEKRFIYNTLAETGFDVKKAADYLDISTKTLQRKIQKHGLSLEQKLSEPDAESEEKTSKQADEDQAQTKNANKSIKNSETAEPRDDTQRLRELMEAYQRRIEERRNKSGSWTKNMRLAA